MRLISWMMTICLIAPIGGCASLGSYCAIAEPIYWQSSEEVRATPINVTRQIVRHNETHEALCR